MKQGILNKDAIARALNLTETELDGLLEDNVGTGTMNLF